MSQRVPAGIFFRKAGRFRRGIKNQERTTRDDYSRVSAAEQSGEAESPVGKKKDSFFGGRRGFRNTLRGRDPPG